MGLPWAQLVDPRFRGVRRAPGWGGGEEEIKKQIKKPQPLGIQSGFWNPPDES